MYDYPYLMPPVVFLVPAGATALLNFQLAIVVWVFCSVVGNIMFNYLQYDKIRFEKNIFKKANQPSK